MSLKKLTNAVDCRIGNLVKSRRQSISMSQSEMGRRIGVTFQQIQKYESGKDRISTSTLLNIAKILDANLSDFLPGESESVGEARVMDRALAFAAGQEGRSFINAYLCLDSGMRRNISEIIFAVARMSAVSTSDNTTLGNKSKL